MTIEQLYQRYLQHPNIQTDTRKLVAGSLFFALKGENFNGNEYAQQALEKGAAAVIVDEAVAISNPSVIRVNNTLETLQQLAYHHRKQFQIPFVAITGSNGKTTTKELIHAVLSTTYKTYTTEGNLNNHIGIPLTILKVKPDAEIAVIEMGANHQEEIAGYCKYALPTHGLITNIGKAHLEGFGGIEGVKKGKGELFDFIRHENGTIFLNTDQPHLMDISKNISRQFQYGSHTGEVTGTILSAHPFLSIQITQPVSAELQNIHTQLVGDYNLPNVLAAVAVGLYFKVPPAAIKSAIERYTPSNSRSQLIETGSNRIILDAYNANPSSMQVAIQNFASFPADHKILMLGAMAEMGEASRTEHQKIVELIQSYSWDKVVLVGEEFKTIQHPYHQFDTSSSAAAWIKNNKPANAAILLKGSRSTKMELVLEALRHD
ncbi:MAG: UDP-N-acetylmuramoyl-tripeptide--D-alanyl-D-alanine ligase [Bacteroidetes bacterium]|nr:UDP-N-acetylmuramoyl-tripeptide--D-alanyl-D-alanine ligase [Bacteroidota bacterium]